ncbi:hypothetical protein HZB60_08730 [candidate division KSB1 bacterium]|nr:hypothetical protein [candidate division KSB1 bacterium]
MPLSTAARGLRVALGLLALLGSCVSSDARDWKVILPSESVTLRDPRALSIGPDDLLYVADAGNQRVVAVDTSGTLIAEAGGFGNGNGQFQSPEDVAAEWGTSVWVLDYGNRRIQRFSRSLSWQATYEVLIDDTQDRRSPAAIALAPDGDLIVYDRDGQTLLRYDPGFFPRASFDGARGYVGEVASMAFVRGHGLCWIERGGHTLYRCDAMLNPLPSIELPPEYGETTLAAADSSLLTGARGFVIRWQSSARPADTLFDARTVIGKEIRTITSLAMASSGTLYLLDRTTGRVVRVSP